MRLLRYSINITLDGCYDHRAGIPDEELHRHATETLAQADTLIFGHVKFGVSDYAASKAFFHKALEPLGGTLGSEGSPTYGVELCGKGNASLCLYQTEEKPARLHLAFTAENRQQVDAFYRAALEAGGCKSYEQLTTG